MLEKQKFKFFVVFTFFGFSNLLSATLAVQQCCPGSQLDGNKSSCTDETEPNIDCPNGAYLLNSSEEEDKFWLDGNDTLVFFNGDKIGAGEFCVAPLWINESIVSSNEVALICFRTAPELEKLLSRILMLLSILFLSITLYIYVVLPNLRDVSGQCVMAFICSLLASYITLSAIHLFPETSRHHCIFQGAVLYFFMSATFFWSNIITFNIWKAIRSFSFNIPSRTWSFIYISWGFGVPLLMVTISFILENIPGGNHVRPNFAETYCWFSGKTETWAYFYGPISVLLMINLMMFLHCSLILWKSKGNDSFSRTRSLRYKYMMYLKLFILMGLTWVFEVISFAAKENTVLQYVWILTDCINSAQGIFIFLILVVFRQKVRLGILKKKLLGINWPKSWGDGDIQEFSEFSDATEIELGAQKLKMLNESQNDRGGD